MTPPPTGGPADFSSQPLVHAADYPEIMYRFTQKRFSDPLGCGPGISRFGDIRVSRGLPDPFSIIYLGPDYETCFLETIVRDLGSAAGVGGIPIDEAMLHEWAITEIRLPRGLKLLDLREGNPVKMRIPTDAVKAKDHSLGMEWSRAFFEHPDHIDGLVFRSRLNESRNIAIYDRSISKLSARTTKPIMDDHHTLARVLNHYDLSLITL